LKYKNSNKAYGISEDKFDNIIRLMFESDNSLQQKNKTHIVNGFDIFIDEKDSLGLSTNNKFEPFETKIVNKLIHEGDVVLDIGANVGYYSLLFSKLVGNRGKVYAFDIFLLQTII
jgi:ubiquinone/menaquinone biosynthesis C-methylase UbiE